MTQKILNKYKDCLRMIYFLILYKIVCVVELIININYEVFFERRKSMKNIIIIGPSRVGKSTLTSILCEKYNFNYISGDSIRNAFIDIYILNFDIQ